MQEDPSLIILLSTLIFLLILSGFFSGSETGMMAANKIKLKNLSKKSKTSAKRALNLLKRPDQLLSAILVGNNFANILASAIVTIIMLNYFGGNVLLGSIILTIVILIFSEINFFPFWILSSSINKSLYLSHVQVNSAGSLID